MGIWYIWLVLLAVCSYATQSALYGKYSRKYSWLQVWAIRNISMIFTGLPLLFLVQDFNLSILYASLGLVIITAVLGALHVLIDFEWLAFLPLWVAKVLKVASKTATVLFLSLFVLWEVYTQNERLWVIFVLIGWLRLWTQKIDNQHLTKQNIWLWVLLVLLSWVLSATAWYYYKLYSESLDIFLASYLLEATVWFIFLIIISIQTIRWDKKYSLWSMSKTDVWWMSLIWLLPYIGTIWVTKAFEMWWFWITSLLMNLAIPASFIIGRLLFKEKITRIQWCAITLALLWLVVMKLW